MRLFYRFEPGNLSTCIEVIVLLISLDYFDVYGADILSCRTGVEMTCTVDVWCYKMRQMVGYTDC